jgi:hypothetical protein
MCETERKLVSPPAGEGRTLGDQPPAESTARQMTHIWTPSRQCCSLVRGCDFNRRVSPDAPLGSPL